MSPTLYLIIDNRQVIVNLRHVSYNLIGDNMTKEELEKMKTATDMEPSDAYTKSKEIKEAIEPIIDLVDPIYREKLQNLLKKVEKKILYRTILDEMATATYNQDNQTSKTR